MLPAFAFAAEAGTHLPTPEGWKAELALGGWLITYILHTEITTLLTPSAWDAPQSSWVSCVGSLPCIHVHMLRRINIQISESHFPQLPNEVNYFRRATTRNTERKTAQTKLEFNKQPMANDARLVERDLYNE